jgi:LasA protease
MGVRRKTRSSVRRARMRRSAMLFFIAVVVACLASSGFYYNVMAPAIQAAMDPTQMVQVSAPLPAEQSGTPPSPTMAAATAEATPTIGRTPVFTTPLHTQVGANIPLFYYTQPGDTLPAVAAHFGVQPSDITSPAPIPETGLINPNQLLNIPHRLENTTSSEKVMPDSEVIFSPTAVDFDLRTFIVQNDGHLKDYGEYLGSTGWTTGIEIVQRIAVDCSINPRLLLALLEYQSHWVYGQPPNLEATDYPLGLNDLQQKGFYHQLTWAANTLSTGYYGWREGTLTELTFPDQSKLRLAPDLNAGSVALLYLFAQIKNIPEWAATLYTSPGSLPAMVEKTFGNPWLRAQTVEPLFPDTLTQPEMALPFAPGLVWSFTAGPHPAGGLAGARAALDFAPGSSEHGCVKSDAWVLAVATGLVVRSERAVVVIDLDGDGNEATGWTLLYQHISAESRIPVGTWVAVGDRIGHPSCEGGPSTGTHTHIARKYNGEWVDADGPIPFVLSGWQAHPGNLPLEGSLTRGSEVIIASQISMPSSHIYADGKKP